MAPARDPASGGEPRQRRTGGVTWPCPVAASKACATWSSGQSARRRPTSWSPDRQAVRGEAGRHGDGRQPGDRDQVGRRHPVQVRLLRLAVDLVHPVQGDVERDDLGDGAGEHVEGPEELADPAGQRGVQDGGPAQVGHAQLEAALGVPGHVGAELAGVPGAAAGRRRSRTGTPGGSGTPRRRRTGPAPRRSPRSPGPRAPAGPGPAPPARPAPPAGRGPGSRRPGRRAGPGRAGPRPDRAGRAGRARPGPAAPAGQGRTAPRAAARRRPPCAPSAPPPRERPRRR